MAEKLAEVYKASNEMEAQVIKSLLESFNIHSFLKAHAAPSVHMFTIDGLGEVRVMVREEDADTARLLINRDKNV